MKNTYKLFDRFGDYSVICHHFTAIGEGVEFGRNVVIGPFVTIEKGCKIPDSVMIPAYSHIKATTEYGILTSRKADDKTSIKIGKKRKSP